MKNNKLILGLLIAAIAIAVYSGGYLNMNGNAINNADGIKITVYKSQSCGCCVGYIAELQKSGFNVEVKSVDDMSPIKKQYNIPQNMQSCHTAVVGDYFVEGHVPIEAVNKLIDEQPEIDGIALPNMPAGTPGMPGVKSETWSIFALRSEEVVGEFMTI